MYASIAVNPIFFLFLNLLYRAVDGVGCSVVTIVPTATTATAVDITVVVVTAAAVTADSGNGTDCTGYRYGNSGSGDSCGSISRRRCTSSSCYSCNVLNIISQYLRCHTIRCMCGVVCSGVCAVWGAIRIFEIFSGGVGVTTIERYILQPSVLRS